MDVKSALRKFAEISELLLYSQMPPDYWRNMKVVSPVLYRRRIRLIDKHRDTLTNNRYFTGFIEPLVLRLYGHAAHSRNVEISVCAHGAYTMSYIIRGRHLPILTMGSEWQLQEICKKKCYICPTVVYSPFGVIDGLLQLTAFEIGRVVSEIRDKL